MSNEEQKQSRKPTLFQKLFAPKQEPAPTEEVAPTQEMNYDKAKELWRQLTYSGRDLWDQGLYDKVSKKYKRYNIPKEVEDQWEYETFVERKDRFIEIVEKGKTDTWRYLYAAVDSYSLLDRDSLLEIYNALKNNVDKLDVKDEMISYEVLYSHALRISYVREKLTAEDYEYILSGVKERLGIISQNNPELQDRCQKTCNDCDKLLEEIRQ